MGLTEVAWMASQLVDKRVAMLVLALELAKAEMMAALLVALLDDL
jgi:hypothetical protein